MLLIMLIPGFVFTIVFRYIPMWGVMLAFVDISIQDIFASKFVGLKHFEIVFSDS